MSISNRAAAAAARADQLTRELEQLALQAAGALDLEHERTQLLDLLCLDASTVAEGEEAARAAALRIDTDGWAWLHGWRHELADAVRAELQRRGVLPADERASA